MRGEFNQIKDRIYKIEIPQNGNIIYNEIIRSYIENYQYLLKAAKIKFKS